MTDIVIRAESLGKCYTLGRRSSTSYRTLRESIVDTVKRPWQQWRGGAKATGNDSGGAEFWALRDVSFEIARGEVVGIIGRNGAGKSTLLKVLSRITEPTEGRISLQGRVASLLEVGTGFHPELTGRENVYLNGAILGMQRAEIKAKFDEIVAFAEVEKFLDTPVKRYSSGMYVRLAFSVAAHLEPEILVVDEVLAVGDAEFQKKCLGKMQDVALGAGRTVLFVSHNMGAITQLCNKAIYLDQGRVIRQGEVNEVTTYYLDRDSDQWAHKTWTRGEGPGDDTVKLLSVSAVNAHGQLLAGNTDVRERVGIRINYEVLREGAIFAPSLHLHNSEGTQLFLAIDLEKEWMQAPRRCGIYESTAWIPGNFLNTGLHYASVAMSRLDLHMLHLFERQVVVFQVAESGALDTARGIYANPLPGAIRPILDWQTVAPAA